MQKIELVIMDKVKINREYKIEQYNPFSMVVLAITIKMGVCLTLKTYKRFYFRMKLTVILKIDAGLK